jgi:hypothetical protein
MEAIAAKVKPPDVPTDVLAIPPRKQTTTTKKSPVEKSQLTATNLLLPLRQMSQELRQDTTFATLLHLTSHRRITLELTFALSLDDAHVVVAACLPIVLRHSFNLIPNRQFFLN